MEKEKIIAEITNFFKESEETIFNLAKIKCESPCYNPQWKSDNELTKALQLLENFIKSKNITGIQNLEIIEGDEKTPSLFFSVNPTVESQTNTILFVSHIDKIPFGTNWEKINPNEPKELDGALYGRGIANGLCSVFMIVSLIKCIQNYEQTNAKNIPRIAVLIESSFESQSPDLTYHLTKVKEKMGTHEINQIILLETWSPTNEHFHYIKSTRGLISFKIEITTGTRAVHSGTFGGIIPDPFMIFQNLISTKIETIEQSEDKKTTNIKIPDLEVTITDETKKECQEICNLMGSSIVDIIPYKNYSDLIGSTGDPSVDYCTAYINSVLRPSLNIFGIENMNDVQNASGVIQPYMKFKIGLYTPPTLDVNKAITTLTEKLTTDPPFNAKIVISDEDMISGVDIDTSNKIPDEQLAKLKASAEKMQGTSLQGFRSARQIPSLNYLSAMFPNIPIVVTGLGNTATGKPREPDENVDLQRLYNFTAFLADYIYGFAN